MNYLKLFPYTSWRERAKRDSQAAPSCEESEPLGESTSVSVRQRPRPVGRLGPRRGRASIGSSHLRRARLCRKERRGSGTHHCGCGAARLGARRWKDRKPPLGRIPRIGPTLGEGRPMLGLSISGFERTRFSLGIRPKLRHTAHRRTVSASSLWQQQDVFLIRYCLESCFVVIGV